MNNMDRKKMGGFILALLITAALFWCAVYVTAKSLMDNEADKPSPTFECQCICPVRNQ